MLRKSRLFAINIRIEGMCELVMLGEDLTKHLSEKLDAFPESSESEEEDDIEHESFDMQIDMDFGMHRQRSNTAVRLEKLEQARKKAAKVKHIKWETTQPRPTEAELKELFVKKEVVPRNVPTKSLFTEQLERYTNLPQNPYMHYAIYDGSAQVGVPVRKYKIFLTMLPEDRRNYPMHISCIATAKIQDLIGLILLKCSTVHGDFPLQPVAHYGLYITEEDGEVDRDFPCLDPREVVAKFGFTCLGLVEHKVGKNVCFDNSHTSSRPESIVESSNKLISDRAKAEETSKQLNADMQLKVYTTALEAPFYKSYRVYIVNKVRAKVEIHLGISGEKIEIDPVQQKSSKFVLVKQKAVSHQMDCVAWCEITDTRSSRSTFRVVYSTSFGNNCTDYNGSFSYSPSLQASASFKHYDFEADHSIAEEIVQKINLILELRSSVSRKEYLAVKERKQYKKKSFNIGK